jgi:hypothetical protein
MQMERRKGGIARSLCATQAAVKDRKTKRSKGVRDLGRSIGRVLTDAQEPARL